MANWLSSEDSAGTYWQQISYHTGKGGQWKAEEVQGDKFVTMASVGKAWGRVEYISLKGNYENGMWAQECVKILS